MGGVGKGKPAGWGPAGVSEEEGTGERGQACSTTHSTSFLIPWPTSPMEAAHM